MRIRFITSTPLDVSRGSGTFVGISTLANSLRHQGVEIGFVVPSFQLPIYTLQRLVFNQSLRFRQLLPTDITIGFDMDGYTLSRRSNGLHIASIKGVIADEMRFESGLTHATMRIQAACERIHVHTARTVFTTSQYSAGRIQSLYQLSTRPHIVPELIDLAAWNKLVQFTAPPPSSKKFIVLCVCRFYPRKRLHLLLKAAARLRTRIPDLEIRIVGGGPESSRLKQISRDENLDNIVTWRENISQPELIQEYQQCQVFCLPSVQEGFGIVFLEAMATAKPIDAARAAAVPEVVRHGLLADPESDESLAAAIEHLYRDPALRDSLAAAGREMVKQFDAPQVSTMFLRHLESLIESKKKRS